MLWLFYFAPNLTMKAKSYYYFFYLNIIDVIPWVAQYFVSYYGQWRMLVSLSAMCWYWMQGAYMSAGRFQYQRPTWVSRVQRLYIERCNACDFAVVSPILRPDSTDKIFQRHAKYFASFFWIVSNQVQIMYSSGRNSKEMGEIFGILPRKSARGVRRLATCIETTL